MKIAYWKSVSIEKTFDTIKIKIIIDSKFIFIDLISLFLIKLVVIPIKKEKNIEPIYPKETYPNTLCLAFGP